MSDHSKTLAFIAQCDDVEKLRSLIKNARDRGVSVVADAAFRRLVSLVPSEQPGTVEHDFWQTIHAFEYVLTEERKRTTRLSRTRQKVGRVGVVQTLRDWALDDKETDGFKMQDLSKQFDVAMFEIYRRAKSEAGYNATIFLRMINDRGGLSTAKYLINAPRPSDGYTHLYERGRLDHR